MDAWEYKELLRARYDGSLGGPPDILREPDLDAERIAPIEHVPLDPKISQAIPPAPSQDGDYYQGED